MTLVKCDYPNCNKEGNYSESLSVFLCEEHLEVTEEELFWAEEEEKAKNHDVRFHRHE